MKKTTNIVTLLMFLTLSHVANASNQCLAAIEASRSKFINHHLKTQSLELLNLYHKLPSSVKADLIRLGKIVENSQSRKNELVELMVKEDEILREKNANWNKEVLKNVKLQTALQAQILKDNQTSEKARSEQDKILAHVLPTGFYLDQSTINSVKEIPNPTGNGVVSLRLYIELKSPEKIHLVFKEQPSDEFVTGGLFELVKKSTEGCHNFEIESLRKDQFNVIVAADLTEGSQKIVSRHQD